MFRRTDPQGTFGSLNVLLCPERIARLQKKHRAGAFRKKALPRGSHERYLDREGYFADAPSSDSRRRLSQCAADVWRLVNRFRGHLE